MMIWDIVNPNGPDLVLEISFHNLTTNILLEENMAKANTSYRVIEMFDTGICYLILTMDKKIHIFSNNCKPMLNT